MDRKRAKELAPIIKAFGDGKVVQHKCKDLYGTWNWVDVCRDPLFSNDFEYRIKPEPLVIYAAVTSKGYVHCASRDEADVVNYPGTTATKFIEVIE